jgi:acyl-coenzyme A synthetase/AMP-(fatty) acid ligase/flavin reductase (DIM6/NTAB) family NADH-FMN oxidoreductase RutF
MSSSQSASSVSFRAALGAFTTGVTVVTTKGTDGSDTGLTANSFNSVSLDPPMVLWSLSRSSLNLEAFTAARYFAIHVLSSEQQEISRRFATRSVDKFSNLELERGPGDIPLLADCAARFICETTYHYEGGDHIIFVGTVQRFDQSEKSPLLFHGGQYARILKPPEKRDTSEISDSFLGHLLQRCFRKVYAPVRQEFERRSITKGQYYLLVQVAQNEFPGRMTMQYADEMSTGSTSAAEQEVLIERGWIERRDDALRLTARGRQFYIELSSIIKAAESDAESALDYDTRQTFKLILLRLLEVETTAHQEMLENLSLDTLCRNALHQDPQNRAVEFEKRWFPWGEMRQVSDQLSNIIESFGAGVVRVAFIARNRPSSIAGFLGLMANRCAIRMLYPFQSPEIVARELEKIDPVLFVASDEDYSPALLSALENRRISALVIARHLVGTTVLTTEAKSQAVPPILMFPVSNISGIYSTLPPLLKGQSVVLVDRFTVDGWRDYVIRFKPQVTGLPPAGIQMLLDADVPCEDLKSIRAIGTGAAPLDVNVQRAFEERYGIPILFSYGATEFGGPIVAMTLDLHLKWGKQKFGSVGKPMPGVSVRVIDADTGAILPPGKEGLLEVISPRMGPDWIRTSDIANIDEDGFLFLIGRADGAIMRGGFKLLPPTIEHALLLHDAVLAASVVGVKDRRLGEVPAAAIEFRRDADRVTVKELEDHLRKHLPATHIPVHWRFVDSLPRTLSMKADQTAVRHLFAEETAKSA